MKNALGCCQKRDISVDEKIHVGIRRVHRVMVLVEDVIIIVTIIVDVLPICYDTIRFTRKPNTIITSQAAAAAEVEW